MEIVDDNFWGIKNKIDRKKELQSAKTWDHDSLKLSKEIIDGARDCGYERPSKIQGYSIPLIVSDPPSHLIAQSKNGTGKTGAFVIGSLSRVDINNQKIQVIALANTRELCNQIYDVYRKIGAHLIAKGMKITTVQKESKNFDIGHVVVTTPAQIDKYLKKKVDFSNVKILVVDEADTMFVDENVVTLISTIINKLPDNKQIMLFSATYNDKVREMVQKTLKEANQISLKKEELTLKYVKQTMIKCEQKKKFDLIGELYKKMVITSTIIFINTRSFADTAYQYLTKELGLQVSLLKGGDMPGYERDKVIEEFRKGDTKVLITTNVLSRGIDIPQVNLVINFDLPTYKDQFGIEQRDKECYLHRVGRTGRFGKVGVALNIVTNEKDMDYIEELRKYYNCEIQDTTIEKLEKYISDSVKENTLDILAEK